MVDELACLTRTLELAQAEDTGQAPLTYEELLCELAGGDISKADRIKHQRAIDIYSWLYILERKGQRLKALTETDAWLEQ